jgi:hypothetical protein
MNRANRPTRLFLLAVLIPLAMRCCLAFAQGESPVASLFITMHTAPMDNYCPPCMASEKLLKEAHLEFKKVLEPMGPWPWFLLTDKAGNQRIIRGGLSQDDVDKIKIGEWPDRR